MRDFPMRDFNVPSRSAAIAANGMAATSHPLATLTALDVLRAGGNAVDAAIAAVAMQCVVEPQSTGIGGDCFVLYSKNGRAADRAERLRAARRPRRTLEWYAERQIRRDRRADAARRDGARRDRRVVPAQPRARHTSRFRMLEPAAEAAEDGYVVTPRVAWDWARNASEVAATRTPPRSCCPAARRRRPATRCATRRSPAPCAVSAARGARPSTRARSPSDIVGRLKELGGLHEEEDFAAQRARAGSSRSTPRYRGYDVYECPPNGQGLTALMILKHA